MMLTVWLGVLLQRHEGCRPFREPSRLDRSTHCIGLPVSQPAASCAMMRALPILLLLCAGKGLTA